MVKVFDAYCKKKSLKMNTVRFLFDGQRISETATASELE